MDFLKEWLGGHFPTELEKHQKMTETGGGQWIG
jgi:hypothetical protein